MHSYHTHTHAHTHIHKHTHTRTHTHTHKHSYLENASAPVLLHVVPARDDAVADGVVDVVVVALSCVRERVDVCVYMHVRGDRDEDAPHHVAMNIAFHLHTAYVLTHTLMVYASMHIF
jgi:hypothetical protein